MFSHQVKLQDKEISELCKGVVDESEIARVKEWLEKVSTRARQSSPPAL